MCGICVRFCDFGIVFCKILRKAQNLAMGGAGWNWVLCEIMPGIEGESQNLRDGFCGFAESKVNFAFFAYEILRSRI